MIEPAARNAWRTLEAKLRPFIARRVGTDVDVDDVLQDVFLRMQRGLPALRDERRFGPWVYRIARNAIVDHRRASSRRALLDGEPAEVPAPATNADGNSAEAELAACIAPFVAMLRSPYREALTLVELEGLSQKQAAEMLGISLSGMKSRVQRGRALLRKALEDCCRIGLDARGGVLSCEYREDGKLPDSCCAAPRRQE